MAGEFPNNRQGSGNGPQQMCGFLNKDYVYGVHVKLDGNVLGYKYRRSTGAIQTIDLSTVVSNQLELPLFIASDDHYGIGSITSSADQQHIFGNCHDGHGDPGRPTTPGSGQHHVVCTDTSQYTNSAVWQYGGEPAAALDSSADGGTYTYSMSDRMTDGTLLWWFTQSPFRLDSRGRNVMAYKKVGTNPWAPLLSSGGKFCVSARDMPQGTTADRVYILGVLVDPQYDINGNFTYDKVWFYGIWRTMDEDAEFQQQPFLMYCLSTNLDNWFAVDGTPVVMPNAWATRNVAAIPFPTQFSNIVPNGIWIGKNPFTVAVAVKNGNATVGDQIYHRIWYDTSWHEAVALIQGSEKMEITMPGLGHGYIWNGFGRVVFRGFSGNPTTYVGTRISSAAAQGGGSFWARHCPVLLRENNLWLANIGEGDTPKIWTIGGDAFVVPKG